MTAKVFLVVMAALAAPAAYSMLTSLQYATLFGVAIGVTSLIAAIIGFFWLWKNSDKFFYEEIEEPEDEEVTA